MGWGGGGGLGDIRGHNNAFQVLLVIGAQFMLAIKTEARRGEMCHQRLR